MTDEELDVYAAAAFNAHWPRDNYDRFKPKDPQNGPSYVQEQYRAIARAVLDKARENESKT